MAVGLAFAASALAQTNPPPVRVAIISAESSTATVADLLTAELSGKPGVVLLERAQIEKIYREQALSSANQNYVKLGQLLGADGLLLLQRQNEGTNEWLGARLIAVKPGVIIGGARAPWPMSGPGEWAAGLARRFQPLLPKLSVLARDAIPVSVVNLRSALRSSAGEEAERQLTLLLIERLTRQREVFVLERRRMDLLSAEKKMGGNEESAFWNGSYLVEGVLDRDGYSQERLTINASLVPPRGGARIELAVAGARDDLGRVADDLARKILQSLNQSADVSAWQPEEEARKYFEEAKWALKWRMLREAQAAADAAWALGKRDLDCATLRVKAYLAEAQSGGVSYGAGSFSNETGQPERTDSWLRDLQAKHPRGVAYSRTGNRIEYQLRGADPDGGRLDRIRFVMELYQNFARTLPTDEPKSGSPWYQLGVEVLESASQFLNHYQMFLTARAGRESELAELRAECRELAAWLSRSKSVRDAYWVGDAVVTHDTLAHTIAEGYNIYRCKIRLGALWQERPEDAVAMCRELASSSVFAYLHQNLWSGAAGPLRSAVWNPADQPRVEPLWRGFISDLVQDTNLIRHLEGRFLEVANTPTKAQWTNAFESVLSEVYSNEQAIIGHNVELMYLNWGLSSLADSCPGGMPDDMRRRFYAEHLPRLEAMNRGFWNRSISRSVEQRQAQDYQGQLRYLQDPPSFNMSTFMRTFMLRNNTRAQAVELKPWAMAYRSNLVAQAATNPPALAGQMRHAVRTLDRLIADSEAATNPAPATPRPPALVPPTPIPRSAPPVVIVTNTPSPVTNALPVVRFERIPWERLTIEPQQQPVVYTHRVHGDELLLELGFVETMLWGTRNAVGLWNLKTGKWRIISTPARQTFSLGSGQPENSIPFTELHDGALYTSLGSGIFKYQFAKGQWEQLPFPQAGVSVLQSINGRLFGGNGESVFEILDGGSRITLLASSRRRPAATRLDSLESLSINAIFPAENGALRVAARGGVYEWDGHDWLKLFSLQEYGSSSEMLGGCVLFRGRSGFNSFHPGGEVRVLWPGRTNAQLCWTPPPSHNSGFAMLRPGQTVEAPFARLKPAVANRLGAAPMAVRGSNVFCFVESVDAAKVDRRWQVTDVLGRHADLYVLGAGRPRPIVIPLRFNLDRGQFPSDFTEQREGRPRFHRTWLEFAGDQLLIGQATTPGIWLLPVAILEARIRAEDDRQQAASNRLAAELMDARRRYDANGDGTLQPEEKERALADTTFLRGSLSEYQSRPGSPMSPENLRWFDANADRILQPVEAAAITNAELFVAQQLIEEFDENADGALQRNEVTVDITSRAPISISSFGFADSNHDEIATADELAGMLRKTMLQSLRFGEFGPRGMPGFPRPSPQGEQSFKDLVETYWVQPPRSMPPFGRPPWLSTGGAPTLPPSRPAPISTNSN